RCRRHGSFGQGGGGVHRAGDGGDGSSPGPSGRRGCRELYGGWVARCAGSLDAIAARTSAGIVRCRPRSRLAAARLRSAFRKNQKHPVVVTFLHTELDAKRRKSGTELVGLLLEQSGEQKAAARCQVLAQRT